MMNRIVIHWTGGSHVVSELDKEHYHRIYDGKGKIHNGKFSIADNENVADGTYAKHTFHCNLDSIGVSLACMAGAREAPFFAGKFPMNKVQFDVMINDVASLAKKYKIPITPKTILTHAEVQPTLGIKQKGKWDIARIAFLPNLVGAKACGDYIRSQLKGKML